MTRRAAVARSRPAAPAARADAASTSSSRVRDVPRRTTSGDDRSIAGVLNELGYSGPDAQTVARTTLEENGLTNSGKRNIRTTKIPQVRDLLRRELARSCGDSTCSSALVSRRVTYVADARDCENCAGSDNKRAAKRFADACVRNQVVRVVIVGGSPGLREELHVLMPTEVHFRLIDGTARRNLQQARADGAWADLVLVWGPSQLQHKVSNLYTDLPTAFQSSVVVVTRRGIAALLDAGTLHLTRVTARRHAVAEGLAARVGGTRARPIARF
jgi:hypothetical protein